MAGAVDGGNLRVSRRRVLTYGAALMALVAGCTRLPGLQSSGGTPTQVAQSEKPQGTTPAATQVVPVAMVLRSEKPQLTSPDAPQAEVAELVKGNTAFALDLYKAVRGQQGNLFFSPYSISPALAMTYAGARGETEELMAEALQFTLSQDRLHPAFNALTLDLVSRVQAAENEGGSAFKLNIANSIWGQSGYKFREEFLDTLAQYYGAGLRLVDFRGDPERSRVLINDWVAGETNDKIKDLIPQGVIDSLTRLVLANAIYFKAAWYYPFDSKLTQEGRFYLLDGGEVSVPMMSKTERYGYAKGEGYQAIELPYAAWEASMVIILPDAGKFEELEASLDAESLEAILGRLDRTNLTLKMPKFKVETTLPLKPALEGMGMADAFRAGLADFSGMDGTRDLFISAVLHKAFVSVDEAGTEAAAATAVIVQEVSVPLEPIEVTVDRPFVFVIRDNPTGSVLFVGRVVNPVA